ncbi:hypothetical protein [Microcoleus sp. herbarium2]|uniref:hypothetical protein n=1 Tax=Microcoleus sp. herbarium2 TaxID=3055433 RepID=UPI002FCEAB3D
MLKEEGSSATDYVTDVTDVTDVRKSEEVRWKSEKRTTFKLLETGFLGVILFWWKLLKRKS